MNSPISGPFRACPRDSPSDVARAAPSEGQSLGRGRRGRVPSARVPGTVPRRCPKTTPSVPQIRLPDAFVRAQLRARALQDDVADLEQVRAARQLERRVRVLLDEEDGQSLLLVQPPHEPEELVDDD